MATTEVNSEFKAVLNSNGGITIPKDLREKFGLKKGTVLRMLVKESME